MAFGKPIPGETPIDDLSGLKMKGITTRRELNEAEAENVRQAVARYLAKKPTARQAPFDLAWVQKLHKQMFGRVWRWAGIFRAYDTNIGVAWEQIEMQMYELTQNLPLWKDAPFLHQGVQLHHRAVQIHPFPNGNGRWARLLANIWLARNGQPITDWPEAVLGDTSLIRNEYIAAIRSADEGDEEPLLKLHQKYTPADAV